MKVHVCPSWPLLRKSIYDRVERDLLQQVKKKTNNLVEIYTVDDMFAIWPHRKENLIKSSQAINSYHRTIKFPAEWSKDSVTLLVMKVISEGTKLKTDLYTKLTDTHQHLHQSTCTCHPSHCKNSIAYSQALRLHRVCSRHMDY